MELRGVLKLPEHSHCIACGDPCPEDKAFCDDDCAESYMAERDKARKKDVVFWVAVGLAIGGLVLVWLVL